MTKQLGGAGGGGSPTIVNDNVRSQDSVEFILGICEGPIAGLIDGPKSFYVGDTPLVAQNGDLNFEAFEVHMYHGETNPTKIVPSFGGNATNVQVGVSLAQYVPVTRTTPNSARGIIDRLEVRIAFNQLVRTNDDGDQLDATANFTIKYRKDTESSWRNFTGTPRSNLIIDVNKSTITGGLASVQLSKIDTGLTNNLKTLLNDEDLTSFALAGATTDTRTVGSITYNRKVVTTYGTLWFNNTTGQFDFVINETAADALAPNTVQHVTFTVTSAYSSSSSSVNYTCDFDVSVSEFPITTITAKTGSTYIREYVLTLPVEDREYTGDWVIQVERLTTDTDENLFVDFAWESYQYVNTNPDLKFENLAVLRGLGAGSNQFSSIPTFSGVYAGKLIKVPTNYNPVTRVYTGTWDGTFKLAFSDNPAWCLYDVLMDTRYGLKYHIPSLNADRYSFYSAAQWCDELVPRNGSTGYQPRYTYNDLIDQQRNGMELPVYIAATFGGILTTDLNGTVVLKVDRPGTVAQVFGPESVTQDGFQYQMVDVTTRVNDMTVSFINPELNWAQDVRRLTMEDKITRNGRIPQDFVAVGCIDPFEAQRRAWLRMLSANTEITTVTFSTSRIGILLEPYDLIGIADPAMNWGLSGRIKSIDNQVLLNQSFDNTFTLATNVANVTVTNNGYYKTLIGTGVAAPSIGANTNGAYITLDSATETTLRGKTVRVRIQARKSGANPATRLRSAYATRTSGVSSGYQYGTLSNEFQWFEYTYAVPDDGLVNGDRIAFWPDQGASLAVGQMDIGQVVVEISDGLIYLRDPLYLSEGAQYTMTLQGRSGPVDITVENIDGAVSYKFAVVSGTIPADLPTNALFALSSTSVGLVKPFRVLSIQEGQENADSYTITAIEVNTNKYGDADNLVASGTVQYSYENSTIPKTPRQVKIESGSAHLIKNSDGSIQSRMYVTWTQDPSSYSEDIEVYYKRADYDNYSLIRATGKDCYIPNVQDGKLYNVMLKARNAIGKVSPATMVFQHTVVGKTAVPTTPTGITTSQLAADVRIDWSDIPDIDFSFYEIRIGGTSWETATKLGTSKVSAFTHFNVTSSSIKYWVKSVDTTGNYSAGAASITHTVSAPYAPSMSVSVIGTNYVVNIDPAAGDVVPIKEYVLKLDGMQVFRGAALTYSARVTWSGTKTMTLTAVNTAGVSSNPYTTTLTITPVAAVVLTGSFNESSYTLSWNVPYSSLPIEKYVVYDVTNGVLLDGDLKATTYTVPISWIGSRQFKVYGVDSAGTAGASSFITGTVVEPSVVNLQSKLLKSQQTLTWQGVKGTLPIKLYRVYLGESYINPAYMTLGFPGEFNDVTQVATLYAETWSQQIDWFGARVYAVEAEDILGNVSTRVQVVENIDPPVAPVVTAQIVDKSIRLDWEEPVSELTIREYMVNRAATFVQKVSATTALIPINFSGSRLFKVKAIDEAGNEGDWGTISVSIDAPSLFTFDATVSGDQIKFAWGVPTGTLPIQEYVITRGASDTLVTKIKANSYSMKADFSGIETFKIYAVDVAGNSSPVISDTVEVTAPSAPVVKAEVLDNNVMLRWTNGTGTLPVVASEIRRGATFATATVLQQIDGTFAPLFEFYAGTYTYWVVNIDSAGNYGTPISVTAQVSQPPDYVLQADFNSAFGGTKTNCYLDSGKLHFGVSSTETYEQHWTGVSNSTVQDQIDDGYSLWLQPTVGTTSSYRETYDYGTLLTSSLVTITPTIVQTAGNPTVSIKIESRALTTDPWTVVVDGANQGFASNFRYIRFTVTVNADTKDDLLVVSAINVRLNSKLKTDSGQGTASSTDAGGTTVTFTTSFIDVQAIVVTPLSTAARFAVYDFVDVPYPTSFKVLMFDTAGNRVSGNFSWTARGF